MDKWIKIGLKIARPHIVIVVLETLIAFALLIYSSLCLQPSDILSIVSYVLSFYALVIVCFRIPDMIKFFKHIRNDNQYVVKYRSDVTIRIKLSSIHKHMPSLWLLLMKIQDFDIFYILLYLQWQMSMP